MPSASRESTSCSTGTRGSVRWSSSWSNSAAPTACSAGVKNRIGGGGARGASTPPAVTGSQVSACASTSNPGKRRLAPPPGTVPSLSTPAPRRKTTNYSPSRRRIAASRPIPPTMVTSSGGEQRRAHLDVVTPQLPTSGPLPDPARVQNEPLHAVDDDEDRHQRQDRPRRPSVEPSGHAGSETDGTERHRQPHVLVAEARSVVLEVDLNRRHHRAGPGQCRE